MDYIRHPKFLIKVGENIRRIRTEKGISQLELSYITVIRSEGLNGEKSIAD